jgi:hypothetical protein
MNVTPIRPDRDMPPMPPLWGDDELRAPDPSYKLWTPPEIWAEIVPPKYAIGTLGEGDIAMVCAHGSSLKSWLAVAAVLSKAAGAPWLERFPCDAAPALYLDNEMGADECRRRMQRCALAMGHDGPISGVGLVSMPGFMLSTPEGLAAVNDLAKDRRLLAIDSLAAFQPGVNENETAFADPLKRMKEIADRTRCAFMLLHHSRKAQGDGEDMRERPRGTSALFAACDAVFQLSRHGGNGGFLVTQTKARKGKAAAPFVLHVDDIRGVDATRVHATSPETDDEEEQDPTIAKLEQCKRRVLTLIAESKDIRSVNELHRRVRGRKATVVDAIGELEERGLVTKHGGAYALVSQVARDS